MNERIRQLAEQAKKHSLDAMIKITDREQALKVYSESYDTKFAELIVAECLDIVDDAERGGSNEIWDNAVKFIRRDLQQHFGVKL